MKEKMVHGAEKKIVPILAVALVLALASCGSEEQAQSGTTGANDSTQSPSEQTDQEGRHADLTITTAEADADGPQDLTPLVAEVPDAPIPFAGSDGRTHLVYELQTANFSNGETTIEQLEVLDPDTGNVIDTLDEKEVSARLQPAGLRDTADAFDASMTALIFLHVTFENANEVPDSLIHRLSVQAAAAPPDQQQITEEVGPTDVNRHDVAVLGPPLRGSNFIAADSCCDATRHTRAALPINGQVWLAQRYAVDYEQLDADGRIYSGEQEDPESYTIYGQEAIAVADGTVVKVVDGLPEQTPGEMPQSISPEEADGNSVILDIGGGNYALYAHFQPGSIRVQEGDRVRKGDVLALVGDSGNSLAPHLHFHVMGGPLSLASNGLPYAVDSFTLIGRTPGTDAFDEAEAQGTPLEVTPVEPPEMVTEAMPLDQTVVNFD